MRHLTLISMYKINDSCKTRRGCETVDPLPHDRKPVHILGQMHGSEYDTMAIPFVFDGIMDEVMEKEGQMEALCA